MDKKQFQLHAAIEDDHWWFVARRKIVTALLAEVLPPSPERLVVEVGMGTGGNLKALSRSYQCIGIETDPDASELARGRLSGVQVCEGDALTAHADAVQQADAILLLDVLEHIEDDAGFFKRIVGLAKPGALIFITVPACPWLWSPHDNDHHHFRRYMPDTLKSLWAGAPIKELMISFFNSRLYPLIRLARIGTRRRGKVHGEAGTDLSVPAKPVNLALERIFRGEKSRLVEALRSGSFAYRKGVSLVAVLRRT